MTEFKATIKNYNFDYLWASQILSQLTINIMNFLLLTRLFETTGSAIATSLLWVAYSLPALFAGPFGSASVDMVDRRRMLMVTNLLQSLTVFIYALLHQDRSFLVYGVAFAYSLLNQFYVPAESASLPSVVEKKDLPFANGLFLLTQEGSLIVGFGVAGIMNNFLGFTLSLYICAAFLFAAFVAVYFLPKMPAKEEVPGKLEEAVAKFFSSIGEGYSFVKERNTLIAPYLLWGGLWVAFSVLVVNVPIMARDILRISVNSAGTAVVVPAGIGATAGSLLIPKIMKRQIRKKEIIEASLMGLTLILFGLAFIIPLIPGFLRIMLAFVIITIAGFCTVGIMVPTQTFLQESTPEELRGRVFGNFWFLVTLATFLPIIFSGTLVELLGVRTLLILIAFAGLAVLVFSKKMGQKFLGREVGTK